MEGERTPSLSAQPPLSARRPLKGQEPPPRLPIFPRTRLTPTYPLPPVLCSTPPSLFWKGRPISSGYIPTAAPLDSDPRGGGTEMWDWAKGCQTSSLNKSQILNMSAPEVTVNAVALRGVSTSWWHRDNTGDGDSVFAQSASSRCLLGLVPSSACLFSTVLVRR